MADALSLVVEDLVVMGDERRPIMTLDRLSLPRGSTLGVRGPSGAGKTTLIFALAGLLPNVSGRISWGETDLTALGEAGRRAFRAAHVGMVFQDFLLFDELGPAANAGVFALFSPRRSRHHVRTRAERLLARMGLSSDRSSTATLSGGERQRVAVARALANEPDILLADEPTASLHREAADLVIGDLVAHAREADHTLIVASHDERLLDRMDRVIELAGGARAAA
ncbi:putative ABC transport system ATP-binding protein [Palleronia aestuarii]|uniref:Putative ABC transport system ATP-binding protein n=1 Tax=Palleronia aestuarii TaxID=568105 RepID=A0A2W7NUB3_9RHOB|nr:ATP-binding cassette domain-containing protein [Palleronia aestuarii]PZX16926.1 putative ABC transport system ATP-binding protein [Palleronia aestuarii]